MTKVEVKHMCIYFLMTLTPFLFRGTHLLVQDNNFLKNLKVSGNGQFHFEDFAITTGSMRVNQHIFPKKCS